MDARSSAKRGLSLRWRLMLLVVASIVPLLAFSLGNQYLDYRQDIAANGDQIRALARSTSLVIEGELQARIAALETLATSGALRRGDLAAFRVRAEAVVAERFPGTNIQLAEESGQQVMNTIFPADAPLPVRPNLDSIREVFATGRSTVSDLFLRNVGIPGVFVDVPVKRADGGVAYVLALNPRLDDFTEIIRRQHLPQSWIVTLFDRHGVVIARHPNGNRFVGHLAPQSLLGPLQGTREGIVDNSTSLEGIRLLSAFAHSEKFGWAVGIGVPREELTAPAMARARDTLAIGATLLALALLLALYAARSIARPIESLRHLAGISDREALPDVTPTGLPEADDVALALHTAETERRRSREAELLLRDGVDSIPEGFSIYDSDDHLVMCNDSYRRLFADSADRIQPGARYEDILRAGLARGHYAQAKGREEQWIADRVREHREAHGSVEQRLADGRWVLVTKHRLSNGWVAGLRIDITALKLAEQSLRDSERRFQDIAEVSGDWIWETDREHRFTHFLGQRVDALPIHLEDFVGKTRWEAAGADLETDVFWARHKSDLDAHCLFRHLRYEVPSLDGTRLFITASGKPVFDAGDNFLGYRGTATDETSTVEARRRAEAAELTTRRIFETSLDLILVTDRHGTFIRVSPSVKSILGYDPDEMVGRSGADFIYPEDLDSTRNQMRTARRAGITQNFECRYVHKQGPIVTLWWTGVWSPAEQQHFFTGRDITERKAAEETRGYYVAIIESTADAIIAKDLNGSVTSWNKAAEVMFGYSASAMVGEPIIRLLPSDRRDEEERILAQIRRGERIDHFETVRRRKDGAEIPVSLTISPILGSHGQIIGASEIVRDITERTRMEENLRASEGQLRRAQRLAHLGSTIRDLKTGEGFWSDEAYQIFGVTRETWAPTTENFSALIHPDDREKALATLDMTLSPEVVEAPFECRVVRPNGTVRIIYRENEIVYDEAGEPRYLAGTIQDVTERRQTEEQLRQAQKMEAIGNLTGGMAHDFNNLLGVIVGNLDLARERLGDEETAELVGEALEAAWRGADLTRRLLAFARRQPLRPARIEVNELVNDTVRLLARLLGEDVDISLNLGGDIWPVTVDPAQLQAALANLASNARDAMLRGGRLIIATANRHLGSDYVAAHPDASVGEFVMIEVSDTGTGMSPEVMSRIFEPFFTTKEVGKGTGLGLSMVFGFLKQSDGHVNVYSEVGRGTTFRLYLPRATTDEAPPESAHVAPIVPGAGETVLVVEDNAGMRRLVLKQLRDLGYRVLDCDSGAAALDILQREPVDLLLTDIVMPGALDGVELAHIARERWPALKIVLTSGFPQARVDGSGDLLGGRQLLSKPYHREELAAALRDAFGG